MYRIIALRTFGKDVTIEYFVNMQPPFLGTCWTPEFSAFSEDAKRFKSYEEAEDCIEGIQSWPYFLGMDETKSPEYLISEM